MWSVCRVGEGVCLQQALSQALLCPLRGHNYFPLTLQNTVWGIPLKGEGWQPVWQGEAGDPTPAAQYTTRKRGDQKFIVRLPDALYTVHRCNGPFSPDDMGFKLANPGLYQANCLCRRRPTVSLFSCVLSSLHHSRCLADDDV